VSRVDELIKELCPDGVPHFAVGDIAAYAATRVNPSNISTSEYVGVENLLQNAGGRTDATAVPDYSALVEYRVGDILLGNIRPYLKKVWLSDRDGGTNGDVLVVRVLPAHVEAVLPLFLYFLLSSDSFFAYSMQHAKGAKMPRGDKGAILRFRVPVPPLEVQREIVRILDLFTRLEAELEAELEARRRQHAFYWNSLLTPDDGWHKTTLGEIADIFDGPHATPKKTAAGSWYLSISSLKNGRFDLTESARLGEDEFLAWTRRVSPRVGDTMFSYETRVGQAAYWDRDEPAALGRRMGLLRPRESVVDPRFLTLVYLGPQFQALIQTKIVRGATVDRIPIADISTWGLSIPPLEEQERIVAILDKFDVLVNDLSVGLPAELAARRKQYEHYRDRLLTFDEAFA